MSEENEVRMTEEEFHLMLKDRAEIIEDMGQITEALKSNGLQFCFTILEENLDNHRLYTYVNVNDEHHALDIMVAQGRAMGKVFHHDGVVEE